MTSNNGHYVRLRHIPSHSNPPETHRSVQDDDGGSDRALRTSGNRRKHVVLTISLLVNFLTISIALLSRSPNYETLTYCEYPKPLLNYMYLD